MDLGEELEFVTTTYAGQTVKRPLSPYRYHPLSERTNEFRLVRLESSKDPAAPIKASLEHHSLLNPPPYVGLSYEVGNPGLYNLIDLDGIKVPVSANLFSALHHLRQHGFLLLWIDCICINQSSDEEKSSQILWIQVIYQEAQQVAVWLGPENHGSWRVMRHLRLLRKAQVRARRLSPATIEEYDKVILPELRNFFLRSYWNRVWVIQEVVAGSQVSLFCGWERASWDDLEDLVRRLCDSGLREQLPVQAVECLMKFRNDNIDGSAMSMLEILHRSSFSQSTYPKDKIYAMLRLAFDRSTYLSEARYGWVDEELCMRMTKSYISSKRSLDIMFVARKSKRSTLRLPSWCPDYTCFPSWSAMEHIIKYVSRQDQRTRLGVVGRRWKTTEDTTLNNESYTIDSGLLRVQGACVATVHSIANLTNEMRIPATEKERDALLRHPSKIKASEKHMRTLAQLPETKQRDALGRLLFLLYNKDFQRHKDHPRILNHLLYGFDSEDYEREKLKGMADFNSILAWREVNKHFRLGDWPLHVLSRSKKPKAVNTEKVMHRWTSTPDTNSSQQTVRYLFAAGEIATRHIFSPDSTLAEAPSFDIYGTLSGLSELIQEGLRLMTTEEGHLGWAHTCAEPGDEIFLLTGCSMPVILRRYPTPPRTYMVVGHAYVDGMMEGDFWMDCVERGLGTVSIV